MELGKHATGPVVALPGQEEGHDGHEKALVTKPDRARRPEEENEEHWTEVELFLEMWDRVAYSWNNKTLLRLARYARLEAEAEKEIERRSR